MPDQPGSIHPLYDDIRYPGHGMPPREDDLLTPLEAWGRLVQRQPIGKKVNLFYDATITDEAQIARDDNLTLQGSDRDACPIVITLAAPLAVPRATADIPIDQQNVTGEFPNDAIGAANYPGTAAPITWPSFVAIVEWGVGGAKARAYVDWREGATISVPASFVRVTPACPGDAAANAPGTTGIYTFAAFAAPGWAASQGAARTIFTESVADAASTTVYAVPPFAKDVTVLGRNAAGAVTVATVQFWSSPDGTQNMGNYLATGNAAPRFPVPNGAAYFTVLNGMGVAAPFAVCFGLAIS